MREKEDGDKRLLCRRADVQGGIAPGKKVVLVLKKVIEEGLGLRLVCLSVVSNV